MAMGITYVCSNCGYSIRAWDDGNPYYIDEKGKPKFVYHPDSDRNLATGNMSDMLCLDCGRRFKRDLERQKAVCPSRKCKSSNIVDFNGLNGKPCPKCKQGVFKEDETQQAIS